MPDNKIFQRFDMDLEALARMSEPSKKVKSNLAKGARVIRTELTGKGYIVLESNEYHGGAPLSVIVGAEFGKPIKQDFYAIALRFKMMYHSGPFYIEVKKP